MTRLLAAVITLGGASSPFGMRIVRRPSQDLPWTSRVCAPSPFDLYFGESVASCDPVYSAAEPQPKRY